LLPCFPAENLVCLHQAASKAVEPTISCPCILNVVEAFDRDLYETRTIAKFTHLSYSLPEHIGWQRKEKNV